MKEKTLREHLSSAGKSGKGKSKVRGDSEYYRAIARKRWASRPLQPLTGGIGERHRLYFIGSIPASVALDGTSDSYKYGHSVAYSYCSCEKGIDHETGICSCDICLKGSSLTLRGEQ